MLSPPIPNSDQLHVVERFRVEAAPLALVREYVAEDPVCVTGEYRGSDKICPADLPHGPDECVELTFVDYCRQNTGAEELPS